jgi:serine protease Do
MGRFMRVLLWFLAGTVFVAAIGSAVTPQQNGSGARPTFSIPLPPNQELGIFVQDITPEIAEAFALSQDRGAVVTALDAGTLQAGDVILSVNGQSIADRRSLETVLSGISSTDSLIFQINRNRATRDIVVQRNRTTGNGTSEGESVPTVIAPGFRGVRLENAAPGLTYENGLVVREIDRGTPAEAAGLQVGDVIVDVNNLPVWTVEQFLGYVEQLSGQRIVLGVIRQGIYSVVVVPSLY